MVENIVEFALVFAAKEDNVTKKISYAEGTTRRYREVCAKKVSEVSFVADVVAASYEVGIVTAISNVEALDVDSKKVAED